jgi:predicted dehydrogenase
VVPLTRKVGSWRQSFGDVLKENVKLVKDPERVFSVGVLGAGTIVNTIHLPLLQSMPHTYVKWISDIDTANARAAARAYRVPYVPLPSDIAELPASDVILMAIPYGVRDQYYEEFSKRPSALYVEKPFSLSLKHHEGICSWFPSYNLACGFQRRAWALSQEIRRIIDTNLFGALLEVRFGVGKPGGSFGNNYQSDIRLSGGGVLFESGVHGIDTALFCTRARSAQVGRVEMIKEEGGFDLHTEATLSLRTERTESIECRMEFSSIQKTINGWEFHFENAVASFSLSAEYISLRPADGSGSYLLEANDHGSYPRTSYQMFYEFWSHFLDGIQLQKPNWTSASDSILTTKVIEDLYAGGSK